MTDFITRLIGRTMGLEPTLQPLISPMFSPGFMIQADYSVLQSESIASRGEADIEGEFNSFDANSDVNKFDITTDQSVSADVNQNAKISTDENSALSNTRKNDSAKKSTLIENQNQLLKKVDASSDNLVVNEAQLLAADVNINAKISTDENLSLPNTTYNDSPQKTSQRENQNQLLKKVDASSDNLVVSKTQSVEKDAIYLPFVSELQKLPLSTSSSVYSAPLRFIHHSGVTGFNLNQELQKSTDENLSLPNTSFKDSAQKSTQVQDKLTSLPSLNNQKNAADGEKFLQKQITINENQPDNTSTSQQLVKPLKTFQQKSLQAVSNRNSEQIESRNAKNKALPQSNQEEISQKPVIMSSVRMLISSTAKPQFQTNSQNTANSNLAQNPKSIIENTDKSTNNLDTSTSTNSNPNKLNFVNPEKEEFTSLISPLNNNKESQTVIEGNNNLQQNTTSNQIPRRVETATPPTIQVKIGRIEVRREKPATNSTSKPKSSARKAQLLSLNDYLKQRDGG